MSDILTYAVGGLVGLIVLFIALSFLWNKKWRPRQIANGTPTPTFGNIVKRVVSFILKEDSAPYKRFPFLNRKIVYAIMLVGGIAALVLKQFVLGGAVLLFLTFMAFARTRGVFSQRNAALTRMYQVAESEFRYPRGTAMNPWGMIQIQQWDELAVPGKTVVVFPAAYRSDDPKKRQDFENHFNATLGENNTWSYAWDSAKGTVTCTPVSHIPEMAEYPGSGDHTWNEIPMGLGVDGEVVWDVSVAPHALICGTTGGGKSVAQRSIIFHCIQHSDKWRFLGIDLKRVELSAYKRYDDVVMGIATEVEDAVEIVRFVYDEMMQRYTEMENQGQNHFNDLPNPPKALMLMVDEAYALMAPSGGKSDEAKLEDEQRAEAAHLLGQVARLGRAAGVHMILATQRPDAKVIFGELKQNLAFRYGAGRMDSIASNMVLDSDAGTRTPGGIKGRAAISVFGVESYLQGYFAKQSWIDDWLNSNRPSGMVPGLPPEVENEGMRAHLPGDFSDGEIDDTYSEPRLDLESDNDTLPVDYPTLNEQENYAHQMPDMSRDEEYESAFGSSPMPTPQAGGGGINNSDERRPQLGGKKDEKVREEDQWDEGMESIFQHVSNMEHQPTAPEKKQQRLSQSAPMENTLPPQQDNNSASQARAPQKPASAPQMPMPPSRNNGMPTKPSGSGMPKPPQRPQPTTGGLPQRPGMPPRPKQ